MVNINKLIKESLSQEEVSLYSGSVKDMLCRIYTFMKNQKNDFNKEGVINAHRQLYGNFPSDVFVDKFISNLDYINKLVENMPSFKVKTFNGETDISGGGELIKTYSLKKLKDEELKVKRHNENYENNFRMEITDIVNKEYMS